MINFAEIIHANSCQAEALSKNKGKIIPKGIEIIIQK